MTLSSTTFVLQRRINLPLAAVERDLCDPQILRTYFRVAHPTADHLTRLLGSEARRPTSPSHRSLSAAVIS